MKNWSWEEVSVKRCEECSATFYPASRGQTQKYCSNACRMRSYRRRKDGKSNGKPSSRRDRVFSIIIEKEDNHYVARRADLKTGGVSGDSPTEALGNFVMNETLLGPVTISRVRLS